MCFIGLGALHLSLLCYVGLDVLHWSLVGATLIWCVNQISIECYVDLDVLHWSLLCVSLVLVHYTCPYCVMLVLMCFTGL